MDIISSVQNTFGRFTTADWNKQIVHDLKLDSEASLITTDRNGIKISATYTHEDISHVAPLFEHKDWKIIEPIANDAQPTSINKQILHALNAGASGLWLDISDANADLDKIFDHVHLDVINTFIRFSGSSYDTFIQNLAAYCNRRNLTSWSSYIMVYSEDTAHTLYRDQHQVVINIDASIYNNAGASSATELTAILHHLDTIDLGTKSDANIVFNIIIAIDTLYFEQIAKLRAMRHVVQCWVDKGKLKSIIKLHVHTSSIYLTITDRENNLIRNTIASLSAVLGGADSVLVSPFQGEDATVSHTRRWLRNQLLVIKEESHLSHVNDVGSDAYFVEYYTRSLASLAWQEYCTQAASFVWVEDLARTILGEKIEQDAIALVQSYREKKSKLIGVNKYKTSQDSHAHTYQSYNQYGLTSINIEASLSCEKAE